MKIMPLVAPTDQLKLDRADLSVEARCGNKEVKIKNAFCQLLESAQGGEAKTHSPSRRYRKRIGSLKTPSHDKKQSLIDDWIGRRKVEKT